MRLGLSLGSMEGTIVGIDDGETDDLALGVKLCNCVGCDDGYIEGLRVGVYDGVLDGFELGTFVCNAVG